MRPRCEVRKSPDGKRCGGPCYATVEMFILGDLGDIFRGGWVVMCGACVLEGQP